MSSVTEWTLEKVGDASVLAGRALARLAGALGRSCTQAARATARELSALGTDVHREIAVLRAEDALARLAAAEGQEAREQVADAPPGEKKTATATDARHVVVREADGAVHLVGVEGDRIVVHTKGLAGPDCTLRQDALVARLGLPFRLVSRRETGEFCRAGRKSAAATRARGRVG